MTQRGLTLLDPSVQSWALAHRIAALTPFVHGVTWLGSGFVLLPLVVFIGIVWWAGTRDWKPLAWLVPAYLGAGGLAWLFKEIVARERPPLAQMVVHITTYAYPSGHATQAIATWGMLALLLASGRSLGTRTFIFLAAAIVILAVGASRIYLGVHWLTDVMGGYALGGAWLALLLTIRSRFFRPRVSESG